VRCETDKPGLYAIGEAASGGKDGADRMQANALPYCAAMGTIAGGEAAKRAKSMQFPDIDEDRLRELQGKVLTVLERSDGPVVYTVRQQLQEIVVTAIGYGRNEERLRRALNEVQRYKLEVAPKLRISNRSTKLNFELINALEFQNLVLVSESILINALARMESRGLHDRLDHPYPDADWFKNIHLRLVDRELQQWTTPVEFKYWRPEQDTMGEPWCRGVRIKEYKGWSAEPFYGYKGV
jgi:succinate dehydrogenase/fumarate reductase flavoprotein subunit